MKIKTKIVFLLIFTLVMVSVTGCSSPDTSTESVVSEEDHNALLMENERLKNELAILVEENNALRHVNTELQNEISVLEQAYIPQAIEPETEADPEPEPTPIRIFEYNFSDNPPTGSQTFGSAFLPRGTITITVDRVITSPSGTDVHFTIQNDTAEMATIHMPRPTMIYEGSHIDTITFAMNQNVVSSASRAFIFSFNAILDENSVFDLTMAIFVIGDMPGTVTVSGIDLSTATVTGIE